MCGGWNSVNPDGLDDSGRVVWKMTIVIKAEGQVRRGSEVGYNHRTMVSYGFISYMVPYHTIPYSLISLGADDVMDESSCRSKKKLSTIRQSLKKVKSEMIY